MCISSATGHLPNAAGAKRSFNIPGHNSGMADDATPAVLKEARLMRLSVTGMHYKIGIVHFKNVQEHFIVQN